MFYYYRKNFGFFVFVKHSNILKDLLMLIFYFLLFDNIKLKIRFYRIFGIITSMLGLRSFLRP